MTRKGSAPTSALRCARRHATYVTSLAGHGSQKSPPQSTPVSPTLGSKTPLEHRFTGNVQMPYCVVTQLRSSHVESGRSTRQSCTPSLRAKDSHEAKQHVSSSRRAALETTRHATYLLSGLAPKKFCGTPPRLHGQFAWSASPSHGSRRRRAHDNQTITGTHLVGPAADVWKGRHHRRRAVAPHPGALHVNVVGTDPAQ